MFGLNILPLPCWHFNSQDNLCPSSCAWIISDFYFHPILGLTNWLNPASYALWHWQQETVNDIQLVGSCIPHQLFLHKPLWIYKVWTWMLIPLDKVLSCYSNTELKVDLCTLDMLSIWSLSFDTMTTYLKYAWCRFEKVLAVSYLLTGLFLMAPNICLVFLTATTHINVF